MLLERPDPVVADHADDRRSRGGPACRTPSRQKPNAPSPSSSTTWRRGARAWRRARSRGPSPGIRTARGPASTRAGMSRRRGRRSDTKSPPSPTTIASRSSTSASSPYTRIGCSGARGVVALRELSASRRSSSSARSDSIQRSRSAPTRRSTRRLPRAAPRASPAAPRTARRRTGRGWSRSGSADVDRDDLGLGRRTPPRSRAGSRAARRSRAPRRRRPARCSRAREKNSSWSAGDAAAGEAVQEHGDPQLLGERPQRLLAASPVQAGPGHDRRALGAAQQRRGALDRSRVGRRLARARARPALRRRARRPR